MLGLDLHIRQKGLAEQFCAFAVKSDRVLWTPSVANAGVIVEFDRACSEFGLQPLDDAQVRHADEDDGVVSQAVRADAPNHQRAFSVKKASDVSAVFQRKKSDRVCGWW